MTSSHPRPDWQSLVELFHARTEDVAQFQQVTAEQMPSAYQQLLAHHSHMTVTVEAYFDCRVNVSVLASIKLDASYARKILLTRARDQRVLQFGIVRLKRHLLSTNVLAEIEAEQTPLGRVLIEHDVLREVELVDLWKITCGPELMRAFQLPAQPADKVTEHLADKASTPAVTYGRTAWLHCNGEPAIELLEIITPTAEMP